MKNLSLELEVSPNFSLPEGMVGKFAVVKLWPELKTAEDECIERIKYASSAIGLECFEINSDGYCLDDLSKRINSKSVDFVIHLHYDTPKSYDAFSFAALWNPVRFYHEWGFSRTSRNLTTHNDFLSCGSWAADSHLRSMIEVDERMHLSPNFNLYHSLAGIFSKPSLGEGKLFYVGINWEKITGGKSRHQELLKRLDSSGKLRIYGPKVFQGVKVWAGYKSYVKEIPFDGISMLSEISKSGISLVLSSEAHKESGLMSSRLFESISAGALVICDENPFAKENFGDSLLYINSNDSVDKIETDIYNYIDWAINNPDKALQMVANAQNIFKAKFNLRTNLIDLYAGLKDRKIELNKLINPPENKQNIVDAYFLMPKFSEMVLADHISSIANQDYLHFHPNLVVGKSLTPEEISAIDRAIKHSCVETNVYKFDFDSIGSGHAEPNKGFLGELVYELLLNCYGTDAFMVIAPNEKLHSNHISSLAGALNRNPLALTVASAAIIRNLNPVHSINEVIDFGHFDVENPIGFGRFLNRVNKEMLEGEAIIKKLHSRAMAGIIGNNRIYQQFLATIEINASIKFPEVSSHEAVENLILMEKYQNLMEIKRGQSEFLYDIHVGQNKVPFKKFLRNFLNIFWIKGQIRALKRDGLVARLQKLRNRVSWLYLD